MRPIRLSGLRTQLFLIALLALLPILGLILFTNIEQRQIGMQDAENDAGRLVMLSSSDLGQKIEGARQLLVTLAEVSSTQGQDPVACNQLFANLLGQNPSYNNLAAIRTNGDFYCSAAPLKTPVNVADRDYFKAALQSRQFSIGTYIVGRVTSQPSIVFALPVLDPNGQPKGVVIAALRVDALGQSQVASQLPAGGSFLVLDRNGTVLDRFPDPARWVGKTVPETGLVHDILTQRKGSLSDMAGLDGVHRLYVFAPVQGAEDSIFVSIGIPQSVAFARADAILRRNLLGLGAVTLLALGLLTLLSNLLFLQPLSRLLAATRRLASGELSARSERGLAAAELNQLGQAFNEMAASLEQSTAQLRQAEANYRSLVERTPAISYRSLPNEPWTTLYISPQIEQILGYTPAEWLSEPAFWEQHMDPEDRPRVMAEWSGYRADESQRLWNSTYRMIGAKGQVVWFRDEASPVYDELLGREVLQGVMFDVTEREALQESIRQERDLLEKITQTSPAGILALNSDVQITFANARAGTVLGIDPEAAIDRSIEAFSWSSPEGEGQAIPSEELVFRQVLAGGEPVYDRVLAIQPPNSKRCLLSVNAAPLRDREGNLTGVIATLEDITTRERIEQARRKQQLEYQTILNTVPGLIWYTDRDNRILRVNRAAAEATGLAPEQLTGRRIEEVFPDQAGRYNAENEEVVKTGVPLRGVLEMYPLPSGEKGWALVDRLPYRDQDGNVLGVITFMNDLTERRQRERELEALVSMTSALRAALTPKEMLPIILDQVLELLGVEGALLARLDPGSGEIVFDHAVGAWISAVGNRMPPGTGISARVLDTGEPYWNNHTYEDSILARSYFLGELQAAACVPLVTHREVLGAIWVGKSSDISENDFRILTAIADIAANALHRAELFEQTQTRMQRLMGLHSIDMSITGSLDLRVTMSLLLDQVTTQLRADAADILLLRADTQTLEYAAGRGFAGLAVKNTRLRLGEDYAGRVAVERRTYQVPDLQRVEHSILPDLEAKGERFGAYFAAPLIAKGQIRGVLEVFQHNPYYPDPEWLDFLETLATQAAIAVDNAELFERLQQTNEELSRAYDATIEGWSRALELRDHETQGHSERVMELSMRLARQMSLPEDEIGHFRRGVLLHDIGKMAIPDNILLKGGPLTPKEWQIMRKHPVYAYELLSPIPYLRHAIDVPYAHHERWNGSGYPRGLKGKQIPYTARIFAVVDVWDALRSDRPYRKAWPETKVRDYICSLSGVEFDPEVVKAFLDMKADSNGRHG